MSHQALRRLSNVLWIVAAVGLVAGWFVEQTALTALGPTIAVLLALAAGYAARRLDRTVARTERA